MAPPMRHGSEKQKRRYLPAAARGETILAAARRVGIDVPAVCFQEGFEPEGGCRACMVEAGPAGLAAACSTALEPGMEVRTSTPRLEELRPGLDDPALVERRSDTASPILPITAVR